MHCSDGNGKSWLSIFIWPYPNPPHFSNITLRTRLQRAVRRVEQLYLERRALRVIKTAVLGWAQNRVEAYYAPGGRLAPRGWSHRCR